MDPSRTLVMPRVDDCIAIFLFDLRFEELRGSNDLILKLLLGPWDDEFLVVPPGQTITYLMFKNQSGD